MELTYNVSAPSKWGCVNSPRHAVRFVFNFVIVVELFITPSIFFQWLSDPVIFKPRRYVRK